MSKFQTDFLPIPFMAIQDKQLNSACEKVLGLIYYITEKRGDKFFMSNKYIADVLGLSSGTVQNALTTLDNAGYVKRLFKDEAKRVRSEILCGVKVTKVSLGNDTGITRLGHEVSLESEQNKINYKEISNNKELKQKFDLFRVSWRKKMRGKAGGLDTEFSNWRRKTSGTLELLQRMFNAANLYYAEKLKEYPDGDFEYVPALSVWINKKRWEHYEN